MPATIAICLATFNGARFLEEQLDSIATQGFADWHLYARDDGSTDRTPEILSAFAARFPGRVTVLEDGQGRLGARGNFGRLMAETREPYIAFSDQDDIWRPDKLARALSRLSALETRFGAGTPAMVHADRRLIDATGAEIAPSYWGSRGVRPGQFARLEAHYTFCLAAGSTMLINRALCELSAPMPEAARMYDTWIELAAHAFGVVGWLDEALVDHRRHGRNATGGDPAGDRPAARRPWSRAARLFGNLDRQRRITEGYIRQARAFEQFHGAALDPGTAARLAAFAALPDQRFFARARTLWRIGAFFHDPLRALVFTALAGRRRAPVRLPGAAQSRKRAA